MFILPGTCSQNVFPPKRPRQQGAFKYGPYGPYDMDFPLEICGLHGPHMDFLLGYEKRAFFSISISSTFVIGRSDEPGEVKFDVAVRSSEGVPTETPFFDVPPQ